MPHARQSIDPLEHALIKRANVPASGVGVGRQAGGERQDAIGVKARIDRHQPVEAPDQQATGNEQHDRQRKLRGDERSEQRASDVPAVPPRPPSFSASSDGRRESSQAGRQPHTSAVSTR